MGIHNEPGFTHLKPYPPLPKLVAQMLDSVTSTTKQDPERGFLDSLKHDGKDEGHIFGPLHLMQLLTLADGHSRLAR